MGTGHPSRGIQQRKGPRSDRVRLLGTAVSSLQCGLYKSCRGQEPGVPASGGMLMVRTKGGY